MELETTNQSNFLHDFIDEDLKNGVYTHVQTRFPPEPNGYLHIGHAKAICIDFGTAEKYGGVCNLRLDDTNPVKEDEEYVEAIKEDIKWLGFKWANVYYASDYFDFLFECAETLIKKGLAYVCDLSADEIRTMRGTLTEPGQNSPFRDRTSEENLELFYAMRDGKFANGERVLRAKIDMSSPNITMRDPVMYRVLHAPHHRTGDKWCIYPMYDFAHGISDTREGVTFSLCTLEFENNRPLYNWFLQQLELPNPSRQIEFARMNLNYTLTSKRKAKQMVDTGSVSGWDDPRMATLCGMRRRGYPAAALREFCDKIGVSKAASVIDYALLESCVRDDLNQNAERAMAVLNPLKVIVDNYPEGKTEQIEVEINPGRPELGKRTVSFSRELYIEREDFELCPPPKYFRLCPEREVRLKGAYIAKYAGHDTDEQGNITVVHVTYDEQSAGGNAADGRKIKGTLHWVNAADCIDAEVRLYERLFTTENPSAAERLEDVINPESLTILKGCKLERRLETAMETEPFQFMRQGYFCLDKPNGSGLVFNRTVALKDSFQTKK